MGLYSPLSLEQAANLAISLLFDKYFSVGSFSLTE